MTGGQILQIAGAVLAGTGVYILAQIALHLLAHPEETDKKESITKI